MVHVGNDYYRQTVESYPWLFHNELFFLIMKNYNLIIINNLINTNIDTHEENKTQTFRNGPHNSHDDWWHMSCR